MKVLVCGSRDWPDYTTVFERLARLAHERGRFTVLHGDASGADFYADMAGRKLGLEVIKFPAAWSSHGRAAGPMRNLRMLAADPDLVIAFQLKGSRGTQHTIDEARKRGIAVEVWTEAMPPYPYHES